MKELLFDTHVHLNARQFMEDREETIQRAFDAGVKYMVVVGFDSETIPLAIEIAEQYDTIYAAVGWHPVDAIDMTEDHLKWIEELSAHPKVVAIGEMGLDYHWDKSPKDIQKEVFRKQIQLAKRVQLPIIIHNREATQDIIGRRCSSRWRYYALLQRFSGICPSMLRYEFLYLAGRSCNIQKCAPSQGSGSTGARG